VLTREVSSSRYRSITRFALWSQVVIVMTGASVRLTGSGLGCPDWPNCTEGRFVPERDIHGLIEFVNRLFTGVVSLAVVLAVLGSLKLSTPRRDLNLLAWGLVAGVIGQVLLGRITVLSGLAPEIVMAHFLLSIVLITTAVVLHHRSGLDGHAPRAPETAPHNDKAWVRVIGALTGVAVFTGTVVTAAGPHAGNESAPRLDVDLPAAARLHGAIVVCLLVVSVTFMVMLRRRVATDSGANNAAHALKGPMGVFVVAVTAQGAIGYIQYFNNTPALLVGFHILGACLVWIAVVRLALVEYDTRRAAVNVDRMLQPS